MSGDANFALVVTADDFGIGLQTSRGIIQAHLQGPVTATSMMVISGDHARQSVDLLRSTPNLDVGLHIVLTRCGHKPLSAKNSSGLVDRAGDFLSNGRLWLAAFSGKLVREAVAAEIAAQAELFQKILGKAPTHVDAHHHAHQLPTIRGALLDAMTHGLLPRITRISLEPPGLLAKVASVRSKRLAANSLAKRVVKPFRNAGLWNNDFFFGMLSAADLRKEFPWRKYLDHLPRRGVVEWVVHPGLADETLVGRDDYHLQRVAELEGLIGVPGTRIWEGLRASLGRKSVLARGTEKAGPP